mmetsp:Transcript_12538/g.30870  ORF Transcript_12538/g.30870 Transcript_12538/m.30870 type:complete len:1152 (-) Transcript_12538:302-3757(-)
MPTARSGGKKGGPPQRPIPKIAREFHVVIKCRKLPKGINAQVKIQQDGQTIAKTEVIKKQTDPSFPYISIDVSKVNKEKRLAFCLMNNKGFMGSTKKLGEYKVSFRSLSNMYPSRDYALNLKDDNGKDLAPIQCFFRRVLRKTEQKEYEVKLNEFRKEREKYYANQKEKEKKDPPVQQPVPAPAQPKSAEPPVQPTAEPKPSVPAPEKKILPREMSRPQTPAAAAAAEEKDDARPTARAAQPAAVAIAAEAKKKSKRGKKKKKKVKRTAAAASNFDAFGEDGFGEDGFGEDPFSAASPASGGVQDTTPKPPGGIPGGAPVTDNFNDFDNDPFGAEPGASSSKPKDEGRNASFGAEDPFGDSFGDSQPKAGVSKDKQTEGKDSSDPFGADNEDPFGNGDDLFGSAVVGSAVAVKTGSLPAEEAKDFEQPTVEKEAPPPMPAAAPPPKPVSAPPLPPPSSLPKAPPVQMDTKNVDEEGSPDLDRVQSPNRPPLMTELFDKDLDGDDDDEMPVQNETKNPAEEKQAENVVPLPVVHVADKRVPDAKKDGPLPPIPSSNPPPPMPASRPPPPTMPAQPPPQTAPTEPAQKPLSIPQQGPPPVAVAATAGLASAAAIAEIKALKEEKDAAEDEIKRLTHERDAAQNKAEGYLARAERAEEERGLVEQKLIDAQGKGTDVEAIKKEMADLRERLTAAEALASQWEGKANQVSSQNEETAKDLAEMKTRIQQLEEDKKAIQEESATKIQEAIIATQITSKAKIDGANKAAIDAKQEAEQKVMKLQLELNTAKSDLKEAQIEILDLKDTRDDAIRNIQDELQDAQDAEEAVRLDLIHVRKARDNLKVDLAQTRKELQSAHNKIKELLAEKKRYNPSIAPVSGASQAANGNRKPPSRRGSTSSISSFASARNGVNGTLIVAIKAYRASLYKFCGQGLALAFALAGARSIPELKSCVPPVVNVFGQVHHALFKIRLPQYFSAMDKTILTPLRQTADGADARSFEFGKLEANFFTSLKKGFHALDSSLAKPPEQKGKALSPDAEAQLFATHGKKLTGALQGYANALSAFVNDSAKTLEILNEKCKESGNERLTPFSKYHSQLKETHLPLFQKMLGEIAGVAATPVGYPFIDYWNGLAFQIIRLEVHFFDAVMKNMEGILKKL